ncbi:MAG: hypothetical protein RL734_1920 [Bacteroidota bacterium]|jgi:hypothetical protein
MLKIVQCICMSIFISLSLIQTMNGQLNDTFDINKKSDSISIFGYQRPSSLIGIRFGNLNLSGRDSAGNRNMFSSFELEYLKSLSKNIDLTFTWQLLDNSAQASYPYHSEQQHQILIGLSIVSLRDWIINPYAHVSAGTAISISGGVIIPLHFLNGEINLRYQRIGGSSSSYSGYSAGMNVSLDDAYKLLKLIPLIIL